MKTSLFFVLFLLILPATVSAADGVCACYALDGAEETCEIFSENENDLPFANDSDCLSYCAEIQNFTRHDWADDADSTGGASVMENCTQIEAEATAASTPPSPSSPTPSPAPLLAPRLSIDIPTVTFSTGAIKDGVLNVNYLGDYIAGVYKYLLGISTTIAIVMLMISGLQWTFGARSSEAIGKAKVRMQNAVVGLVLLMGTYVILFTVNPELIGLQFPQLEVVKAVPLETLTPGPTGSANRLCETIDDCRNFCNNRDLVPNKTAGMADPSQTEELTQQPGLYILGTESLLPDTKQKIEAAARIANGKGYSIVVVDAYRPLKEQLEFVCKEIGLADIEKRAPNIPSAIAWPGGSAHGSGTAVDIRLGDTSGTSLWSVNFNSQKEAKLEHVKLLAEIMYEAGFQRYHKEIWHFQTNTGTCTSNQCFGYFGDVGCSC